MLQKTSNTTNPWFISRELTTLHPENMMNVPLKPITIPLKQPFSHPGSHHSTDWLSQSVSYEVNAARALCTAVGAHLFCEAEYREQDLPSQAQ